MLYALLPYTIRLEVDMMKLMNGIRAISFDGDGTLWDFEQVMRHSLQCVLEELSRINPGVASLLDVEKMVSIRKSVAEELKGRVTNLEAIRLEAFRRTLQIIGKPDDALASHLNQLYLKHRFEDIKLFEDVIPTLEALHKNYRLGLVSNGNSYPERCGLEGIFAFVVFAQDHGIEKPDAEIFHIAMRKAGCSKGEFLHIGDSLADDVVGAANAGIRCVWLNRNRISNNLGINIDYEIRSLIELVEIL